MPYRSLFSLSFISFCFGTGLFMVAGLLSEISEKLSIDLPTAGTIISAYGVTCAVGAPLATMIFAKVSPKKVMIIALGLFCLGNLVAFLSESYWILMVGRIVTALGTATGTPSAVAIAATISPPQKRAQAISTVIFGFGMAQVIGVPFGTFIGQKLNWHMPFGALVILGLIGAVLALLLLPNSIQKTVASLREWGLLISDRRIQLALVFNSLQLIAQFGAFSYISAIAKEKVLNGSEWLPFFILIFGISHLLGSLAVGRLTDKTGAFRSVQICMICVAVAFVGLQLVSGSMIVFGICMAMWGLFGINTSIPHQARLIGYRPNFASIALSINTSVVYFSDAFGAFTGGQVIKFIGLNHLFWVSIFLLGVAFLVNTVCRRFEVQSADIVTSTVRAS